MDLLCPNKVIQENDSVLWNREVNGRNEQKTILF
jgi:hypothetical protein